MISRRLINSRTVLQFKRYNATLPRRYAASQQQHNPGRRFYWLGGLVLTAAICYNYNSTIRSDGKIAVYPKGITPEEVMKHDTKESCWIVIDGFVYDLTDFAMNHPGGPNVILSNAGKDVTNVFKPLHASGMIEKYLPGDKLLGSLNGSMPEHLVCPKYAPGETVADIARKEELKADMPPLSTISNLCDFESLASQILTNQAWAYYSSGSDDEITYRENHNAYHRIFFKPRVLVDVSKIDTSTEVFGERLDVPFYVSATALAKLGNPIEGERDITRGCGQGHTKIPQMISTLSSCSVDEIVEAKVDKDQVLWFQLYVNSDRKITEELVKHVEDAGIKALFVTVDAPSLGNREKDAKVRFSTQQNGGANAMKSKDTDKNSNSPTNGASNALSKFIDPSLTWDDIRVLKKITKLPIIIKGVQRSEDVLTAALIGCDGVVISNHGGRQLDFSRAPIEVLAEAKSLLKEQNLGANFDIFIDGGVRRGTDIIKALCLGAKGVGLGRPFLYANSCYGNDGVQKAIDILRYELEMSMRLLGATSIKELNEDFLDLSALHNRSVSVARDELSHSVYKPITPTIIASRGDD